MLFWKKKNLDTDTTETSDTAGTSDATGTTDAAGTSDAMETSDIIEAEQPAKEVSKPFPDADETVETTD